MSTELATTTAAEVVVDDDVLRYLGLDRRNPATVAMVRIAQRYGLDPLLGHVSLIKTAEGPKPYITRDGMLDIAHRSGVFDGIETVREHDGETGWGRTVAVWRKDMSHPFVYSGGCGKQEHAAKRGNGPEMALARAERRALKRAFRIATSDEVAGDDLPAPSHEPYTDVDVDVDEVTGEIVEDDDRCPHDGCLLDAGHPGEHVAPELDEPPAKPYAENIRALISYMNELPDSWRGGVKMQFLARFGHPEELTLGVYHEAHEFVRLQHEELAKSGDADDAPPVVSSTATEPPASNASAGAGGSPKPRDFDERPF